MNKDITYMRRCLDLARIAKGSGKTAVGSLILKDGTIVGEGIEGSPELPPVLAHAEVVAIAKAIETLQSHDLSDCILYTTVEPCLMCSFVIRETKIKHVIYGAYAGQIGGDSSKYPLLHAQDISRWKNVPAVTQGVLQKECSDLLA